MASPFDYSLFLRSPSDMTGGSAQANTRQDIGVQPPPQPLAGPSNPMETQNGGQTREVENDRSSAQNYEGTTVESQPFDMASYGLDPGALSNSVSFQMPSFLMNGPMGQGPAIVEGDRSVAVLEI